jgi:hypothetical protein
MYYTQHKKKREREEKRKEEKRMSYSLYIGKSPLTLFVE